MKKIITLFVLNILFIANIFAQGVVISDNAGDTPNSNSMLEIKSSDKGLLIPRMTTANRISIASPPVGLLVYDKTVGSFFIYGKDEEGTSSWIDLSTNAGLWSYSSSKVYLTNTAYNVGIGTTEPGGKLVIQADGNANAEDNLFEVKDKAGNTVFAISSVGTQVYIQDGSKGAKSGFFVSRLSSAKQSDEYFRVTPDSVRVYIESNGSETSGFAVSRLSSAKGKDTVFMQVMPDSTRVYTKSGTSDEYGGFAVSRLSSAKGDPPTKYMHITRSNYFIGFGAGKETDLSLTSPLSRFNLFFGNESGNKNGEGHYNTFVGHNTGHENTFGSNNVFLGYEAGYNNLGITSNETAGSKNVFLGYYAGKSNISGADNILIGYQAGIGNTSGGDNICIGSNAGLSNEITSRNIFVGEDAGYFHKGTGVIGESGNNIYMGYQSGYGDITGEKGENNVYIGTETGKNNTTGSNNVYIGHSAASLNTSGKENVAIGDYSGFANSTGNYNTYVGKGSGENNSAGSDNTFVGRNSGNTAVDSVNTYVGKDAGKTQIFGSHNTYLGAYAGSQATGGNENIFMGVRAGNFHSSGNNNIYLGNFCGAGTTTNADQGENNVYIGNEAGKNNQTGVNNLFLGYQSGLNNNSGDNNIFFGTKSGASNSTGDNNLFIGQQSGENNGNGRTNVFLGLFSGNLNTTGSSNVFLGVMAGALHKVGNENTFIGTASGYSNDNGIENTFVGSQAGYNNTNGNNNVFIGNKAGMNEVGSDKLYIDNSSTATPLIYGEFNADKVTINGSFTINGGTNSVTLPSTRGTNGFVLTTDGNGNTSWTSKNASPDATTASNGLTEVTDEIQLGGSLTQNTTITLDANNMIYNLSGTGEFDIQDNGVTAFFVQDDGNVGMGTNTPLHKLHVLQDVSITTGTDGNLIDIQNTNNSSGVISGIRFQNGTTVNTFKGAIFYQDKGTYGTGDIIFANNSSTSTVNVSASDARMVIKNRGNVGIGTTTPNATLDVNGSVSMNVSSKTASYTITDTDGTYMLIVSNSITITLPTVADNEGRVLVFQKNSGNASTVTIQGESGELINGANTTTLVNMYSSCTLVSDGTKWRIINQIN